MSKLAGKLRAEPASFTVRIKRGPSNLCQGIYEPDLEDWEAIEEWRKKPGQSWATAQQRWDGLLGYKYPAIPNDKFRYHWRRKCGCWPDETRLA